MRDDDARTGDRLTQFVLEECTRRYVARKCMRWLQAVSIRARPYLFVIVHYIARDLHCALWMAEEVEVGPADGSEKSDAVYLDGFPFQHVHVRPCRGQASFFKRTVDVGSVGLVIAPDVDNVMVGDALQQPRDATFHSGDEVACDDEHVIVWTRTDGCQVPAARQFQM